MPLTKQIIQDAVREVVKEELIPIKEELSGVKSGLTQVEAKVDKIDTTLTDFVSRVDRIEVEHEVQAGQLQDRTDRIEKLEVKVFGQA